MCESSAAVAVTEAGIPVGGLQRGLPRGVTGMGTIYPRSSRPQKDMTAKTWPHTAPGLPVLVLGITSPELGHPDRKGCPAHLLLPAGRHPE